MAGRSQQAQQRRAWFATIVLLAIAIVVAVVADHSPADALSKKSHDHPADSPATTTTAPPASVRAIDPSHFTPGACMAYQPTSGNRHLTVFLDAGHGGIDPGAVGVTESGQTIYEADETLPVELDAMEILRSEGFRVVVSRTGPTSVARLGPGDVSGGILTIQGSHDDVAARDVCANLAGASVLIGVYFDAGDSSYNAGCVTGYDAVRPFAAENLRLATLVQNDVLDAMNAQGWQIPNEGVVQDENLGSAVSSQAVAYGHLLLLGPAEPGYFTTPSQMPGALIEPLFITDPFEGSIAASARGQQVIARGIAQAVEQYFAPPPAPATTTSAPAGTA
jgi:N-acetylmuramoyl-L-alanine amidase